MQRLSWIRNRRVLAAAVVLTLLLPVSSASAEEIPFTSPYNTAFKVKVVNVRTANPASISFSNYFAGFRQVDPLVAHHQAMSEHNHAWLGNRLTEHANVRALYDEPRDWEAGSNAAKQGKGFAAETMFNGRRDGYTPGVWWPVIWDAPPGKVPKRVNYANGTATYYVTHSSHGSDYLTAYPNGLSFIIDQHSSLKMNNAAKGAFTVAWFGPRFWDGRSLDSANHRSHVGRVRSSTHPVAVPEFQVFVKAFLAYPTDPTPLATRIKFGMPGMWVPSHIDYVAGYRQPWFLQWLLDLGPNWGHKDNPLRDCGVAMPANLARRKLEGIRMNATITGGTTGCS